MEAIAPGAAAAMFLRAAVVTAVVVGLASAEVVKVTSNNFDEVVDGSKHVLMEFFAPWCGHCKNLAPEYEIAAETFGSADDVVLAAVDATEEKSLASRYDVKGYPTLKWFPKGSTTAEDYGGGRTADTIVSWINGETGLSRKVKKPPTAVTELTASTFDAAVSTAGTYAMVEFYAPWCGHCKSLKPTYEKLAKAFEGEEGVVIAAVDATEHRDLGQRFDVSGFPTILTFGREDKEPVKYQGPRGLKELLDHVNENAGTFRNEDGTLGAMAGRVEALDEVVKGTGTAMTEELKEQLAAAVTALPPDDAAAGQRYLKIADKLLSKGGEYLTTESARLGRLISGSGSLSATKKTELMLKKNALEAFA